MCARQMPFTYRTIALAAHIPLWRPFACQHEPGTMSCPRKEGLELQCEEGNSPPLRVICHMNGKISCRHPCFLLCATGSVTAHMYVKTQKQHTHAQNYTHPHNNTNTHMHTHILEQHMHIYNTRTQHMHAITYRQPGDLPLHAHPCVLLHTNTSNVPTPSKRN